MSFKAGDLIWFHYPDGRKAAGEIIGELPVIPGHWVFMLDENPSEFLGSEYGPPGCWEAEARYLTPRGKPPADREELGKWSECPWQPEGVRV